ncbi:MAG TPA: hypothetical protein VN541_02010 [Tepidisphaeraceae bacterium]|nr:hypothetical protein [Tepidisphaeraceae bacterium]
MEQGRLAACHAFGVACKSVPELFPYGIYTIPEISMVGMTEEELTSQVRTVRGRQGLDYFIDTVFNYPTLAECYKTAAFDGINRLG